jgi:hypothetical protein
MAVELTVLRLSGVGVPPYSARGLVQTLTHIDGAASMGRTINGRLVDTSFIGHRKYATQIMGRDQQPPALGGLWPGHPIRVDSVVELAKQGDHLDQDIIDGRIVVPGSARMESGFTFYRPRLYCMLVSFSVERDEWGAVVAWSLALEENETPEVPTEGPTESPTEEPTEAPTEPPTESPTEEPTEAPTEPPTEAPTEPPTEAPTEIPTEEPTEVPTEPITEPPTEPPTEEPTEAPTEPPTEVPTEVPTEAPTEPPTEVPTEAPTEPPTEAPTEPPTEVPTEAPTEPPTEPPAGPNIYAEEGEDPYVGFAIGMGGLGIPDRGNVVNPINGYNVTLFVSTGPSIYLGFESVTEPPATLGISVDGGDVETFSYAMTNAGSDIYTGFSSVEIIDSTWYTIEIGAAPVPDVTELEACVSATFTAGAYEFDANQVGYDAAGFYPYGTLESQFDAPARPLLSFYTTASGFAAGTSLVLEMTPIEAALYAGYSVHIPAIGLSLELDEAERSVWTEPTQTIWIWSGTPAITLTDETEYTIWLCPPGDEPPTE